MQAARFGEAFDQRIGLRIEEQQMHIQSSLLQQCDVLRQLLHAAAAAHIDADRDARVARLLEIVDQRGQQFGGQVVHAIETGIFQRLQCDAFAGAGEAADQEELHGLIPKWPVFHWFSMSARAA